MTKKKRKPHADQPTWTPPTHREQVRSAGEQMARVMLESHPKFKRVRDEIARAVSDAAGKVVASGLKHSGRFETD